MHNIHAALSHKMGQRGCDHNGWTSPMERYLSMFKSHVAYALDQRAGLGKNNNLVPKVPHRTSQLQGIELRSTYFHCVWIYYNSHANWTFISRDATSARIPGTHPQELKPPLLALASGTQIKKRLP